MSAIDRTRRPGSRREHRTPEDVGHRPGGAPPSHHPRVRRRRPTGPLGAAPRWCGGGRPRGVARLRGLGPGGTGLGRGSEHGHRGGGRPPIRRRSDGADGAVRGCPRGRGGVALRHAVRGTGTDGRREVVGDAAPATGRGAGRGRRSTPTCAREPAPAPRPCGRRPGPRSSPGRTSSDGGGGDDGGTTGPDEGRDALVR